MLPANRRVEKPLVAATPPVGVGAHSTLLQATSLTAPPGVGATYFRFPGLA